jgi:molybdopterin-guanine dinucleotide biosynthesis protein A
LYTALLAAPVEQVLVIACGMPFFNATFLKRLLEGERVAVERAHAG